MLQGFKDAWNGLPSRLPEDMEDSAWRVYDALYGVGAVVRNVADGISRFRGMLSGEGGEEEGGGLPAWLQPIADFIEGFKTGFLEGFDVAKLL